MTVVGESRVLPETLEQTAARLRPLFATGARRGERRGTPPSGTCQAN